MGVDANLYLYHNVRAQEVATAMGRLAGLPAERVPLSGSSYPGAWYTKVPEVVLKPTTVPEMAYIELGGRWLMVDDERHHFAYFHFEAETPDGGLGRLISVRSTPFWLAVLRRLADLFGGSLTYADCDGDGVDYHVYDVAGWLANDGEPWQEMQQRLWDIAPITLADMQEMDQHAAYKLREMARR